MKYLLDTNACIQYLNGRSTRLRDRINAASDADLVVCSVVKAELYFGAIKSTSPEKTIAAQQVFLGRFVSLPFDDRIADTYARIRAHVEREGTPVGSNDLLIAAIALAGGLTVVTNNVSEFRRVPGLRIEDWES